jgi:hypothetical protein
LVWIFLGISTTVPSYFGYGSISLFEERQVAITHEFHDESNANRSFKSRATLKQQNVNIELLLPSSTSTVIKGSVRFDLKEVSHLTKKVFDIAQNEFFPDLPPENEDNLEGCCGAP